jgi:hypothetical protein
VHRKHPARITDSVDHAGGSFRKETTSWYSRKQTSTLYRIKMQGGGGQAAGKGLWSRSTYSINTSEVRTGDEPKGSHALLYKDEVHMH